MGRCAKPKTSGTARTGPFFDVCIAPEYKTTSKPGSRRKLGGLQRYLESFPRRRGCKRHGIRRFPIPMRGNEVPSAAFPPVPLAVSSRSP